MHTPETQAFNIFSLISIWHIDPERDGSDDSCGYTYPRTTEADRLWIQKEADYEYEFLFGKHGDIGRLSCYEAIFAIWKTIAWRKDHRRLLNVIDLCEIGQLASNPTDNLRRVVLSAILDPKENRRLWFCIYRCYLRVHRPWYKQPRWHVHHWRVHFDFIGTLKHRRARLSRARATKG